MSAGGYYVSGSDSNSAARMNQKSVTIDTGTNLAALSPTYPLQLIASTDATGGFVAGQMYQRNAANSAWIAFTPMQQHDHSAATTAAGGTLNAVMSDNTGQFIYQNDLASPRAGEFRQTLVGGAATVSDLNTAGQWSVQLNTGAVINNLAQADCGGIAADFGSPMKFQTKVFQGAVQTNVVGRIGINIEQANLAVDNTTKNIGFEFCSSAGTSYIVVSGDGTTRSTLATTQSFAGTNSLKLTYTPSVNVVGQVNATTATTKTSNLPNSGACLPDRLMRFGITTSAATTQTLNVYGAVLCYVPNDTWTV